MKHGVGDIGGAFTEGRDIILRCCASNTQRGGIEHVSGMVGGEFDKERDIFRYCCTSNTRRGGVRHVKRNVSGVFTEGRDIPVFQHIHLLQRAMPRHNRTDIMASTGTRQYGLMHARSTTKKLTSTINQYWRYA